MDQIAAQMQLQNAQFQQARLAALGGIQSPFGNPWMGASGLGGSPMYGAAVPFMLLMVPLQPGSMGYADSLAGLFGGQQSCGYSQPYGYSQPCGYSLPCSQPYGYSQPYPPSYGYSQPYNYQQPAYFAFGAFAPGQGAWSGAYAPTCPYTPCPHECHPHEEPPRQGSTGTVSGGNGEPITYTTSEGYTIKTEGSTVTITDPTGKHTVQHWGDPHEKVDGKDIGDWKGKDCTIMVGNTQVSMTASGPNGEIQATDIYENGQIVNIDNTRGTFTSTFDPGRCAREAWAEADTQVIRYGTGPDGGLRRTEQSVTDFQSAA